MESMFRAIQLVRDRQAEIVHTLREADVPFALSGSNATFVWIASVDESATRQYRNIEFIIERQDAEQVAAALSNLGLHAEVTSDRILLRNTSTCHDRWKDLAMFAGESSADKAYSVPKLDRIELVNEVPAICLDRLVAFQCSRWLLDDQVDIRDLIEVGLVDDTWYPRLPETLGERLKELIDDPDG